MLKINVMETKNNIHLIQEGEKWIIKEEGSGTVLAEKKIKEEALSFAAKMAKEKHVELIVHENAAEQEGMTSFDHSFPDQEHIET